jgi:uncharacterized protein (DUF1330 family)
VPGYVVVSVDVQNPEPYREYKRQVPATVAQYGGRFIVRGGEIETLEGEPPKRLVVIEFESVDQARTWYHSPEYQAILPIRLQNSRTAFFSLAPGA